MGFWNRVKTAPQNTDVIKKKTEAEIVSDLIRSIKRNIELVLNSKEGGGVRGAGRLRAEDVGLDQRPVAGRLHRPPAGAGARSWRACGRRPWPQRR